MPIIEKLKNGFRTFRSEYYETHKELFDELVTKGQKPEVAVIACSDSRIDPAIVLQVEPGDLFVVRNVANLVPTYKADGHAHGTIAAIEFAVQHLNVEQLIVLGHAHCGGIDALLHSAENTTDKDKEKSKKSVLSPWIALASMAQLRILATMPDASDEQQTRSVEKEAILVSLENLMTFPYIREKVIGGQLRLHGWYVNIENGELSIFNATSHRFEPVE